VRSFASYSYLKFEQQPFYCRPLTVLVKTLAELSTAKAVSKTLNVTCLLILAISLMKPGLMVEVVVDMPAIQS